MKFLKLLVPSAIRNTIRLRRLKQRHGLAHVRTENEQVVVQSSFGKNCRLGGNVVIRHCTFGDYTYIEAGARITHTQTGRFCCIGPGTFIGLASHPMDGYASVHPAFYRRQPHLGYDLVDRDYHTDYQVTRIGNDVWIGAGACIKDGISVSDGAIIGAGAVVTRDVPPYAIVAGVPARVIRYRYDEATIQFLLKLAWWDRDEQWLSQNAHLMRDIERLKREHGFVQPARSEKVAVAQRQQD